MARILMIGTYIFSLAILTVFKVVFITLAKIVFVLALSKAKRCFMTVNKTPSIWDEYFS